MPGLLVGSRPTAAIRIGSQTGRIRHTAAIQASDRPQMFGYTDREQYENISAVSMERKQVCTTHRSSRKAHHPNPLMNAIGQKKHSFTALLTGTTRSFVLTWRNKAGLYPAMCKRNLKNFLNVADLSMDSFVCNAAPATRKDWSHSVVKTRFLPQLRRKAHGRKCWPVGGRSPSS